MLDCFIDGLIDTLKVFPFLLISFYIIEILEHTINSNKRLESSGKYGPVFKTDRIYNNIYSAARTWTSKIHEQGIRDGT